MRIRCQHAATHHGLSAITSADLRRNRRTAPHRLGKPGHRRPDTAAGTTITAHATTVPIHGPADPAARVRMLESPYRSPLILAAAQPLPVRHTKCGSPLGAPCSAVHRGSGTFPPAVPAPAPTHRPPPRSTIDGTLGRASPRPRAGCRSPRRCGRPVAARPRRSSLGVGRLSRRGPCALWSRSPGRGGRAAGGATGAARPSRHAAHPSAACLLRCRDAALGAAVPPQ